MIMNISRLPARRIVHEENRILVDDNVIVHSLCNNLFYNTRKHINFDHEGDWSQFTTLRDTSGNINKIRCFFTKLCEVRSFVQIRRKPPNQDSLLYDRSGRRPCECQEKLS